tara:strand:+ start:112 stop:342 length:231 start_codon:yes stop_codon:yes gene_type:complete
LPYPAIVFISDAVAVVIFAIAQLLADGRRLYAAERALDAGDHAGSTGTTASRIAWSPPSGLPFIDGAITVVILSIT